MSLLKCWDGDENLKLYFGRFHFRAKVKVSTHEAEGLTHGLKIVFSGSRCRRMRLKCQHMNENCVLSPGVDT